jgi:hypothetical protein
MGKLCLTLPAKLNLDGLRQFNNVVNGESQGERKGEGREILGES